MTTDTRTLSIVLLPRFNMMTLTAVIEPLRVANYLSPDKLFSWEFYSPEPGAVVASNAMQCECSALPEADNAADIVAVFGSWGADSYESTKLDQWIKQQALGEATLIGVELGVYALARAGVLSKSHVTTHWCWKSGFKEAFRN